MIKFLLTSDGEKWYNAENIRGIGVPVWEAVPWILETWRCPAYVVLRADSDLGGVRELLVIM